MSHKSCIITDTKTKVTFLSITIPKSARFGHQKKIRNSIVSSKNGLTIHQSTIKASLRQKWYIFCQPFIRWNKKALLTLTTFGHYSSTPWSTHSPRTPFHLYCSVHCPDCPEILSVAIVIPILKLANHQMTLLSFKQLAELLAL